MFHVHVDAAVHAMILQGANHLQTGTVADMGEPWIFVAAKIALQNAPVFCAIENCSPCFQFAHAVRRFFRVQLGHAPLIHILTAPHRVGEMHFPIVALVHIGQGGGDPTFGHHGVRFAK